MVLEESEVIEHIYEKVSSEYMERDSYGRSPHIAYWRHQRDVYHKLVELFFEDAIKKAISLRSDLHRLKV